MTSFTASFAIPPPPEQISVDCDAPVYAIDRLVCDDTDLRAADRHIAEQFSQLEALPFEATLIEEQQQWFRRRAMCAFHKDGLVCLRDAYAERAAVLDAIATTTADGSRSMKCAPVPWPGVTRVKATPKSVVLFDDKGAVKGVALPRPRASSWEPWLKSGRVSNSRVELTADGAAVSCVRAPG